MSLNKLLGIFSKCMKATTDKGVDLAHIGRRDPTTIMIDIAWKNVREQSVSTKCLLDVY